jgi:hypothetical protein
LHGESVSEGCGFTVGQIVRLSCPPESAQVTRVMARYFFVAWLWARIDAEARNVRWDGCVAFPRDPGDPEWENNPWRVEPNVGELTSGHACIVGIPAVDARITAIVRYAPPLAIGWLPRPEWALGMSILGVEAWPAGTSPSAICTRTLPCHRRPPAEPGQRDRQDQGREERDQPSSCTTRTGSPSTTNYQTTQKVLHSPVPGDA